jgi:hypothetical protein
VNSHAPSLSFDAYSDRVANASMLHAIILNQNRPFIVMLITKFTPYLMLITQIRFFARQVSAITFFA